MATETNLTKVNVFPSEQSYETNKSSLGTGELSLVKMANSFFSGVEDYSFGQSGSSGGYIKYANGLMLQWGSQEFNNDATDTINFNQPYSSEVYIVIANHQRITNGSIGGSYTYTCLNGQPTTTGFSIKANVENGGSKIRIYWISLGDWA